LKKSAYESSLRKKAALFSQENAPQTNITFYYTEKPKKNQAYPEKIFKFGFFTLSGQKSLAKQKKLCYNKKCVNLRRFCEVVFHSVPVISAIEMRVKIGFTDDCLFGRTGKTSFYRR
jgi:hypothetical protein